MQLLCWHFYFWRRGITTFTHIQFLKAKAEKLKEVDDDLLTNAAYDEWLAEFDKNLERFKYESKIKKLVILKKTNAVGIQDAISAVSENHQINVSNDRTVSPALQINKTFND